MQAPVPYKAPEMLYDGKRSTPADIYSFGCVLIELTTSRRVWGTMDGFQITAKVCGSYQLLPEPPSTDAVPEKLLVPSDLTSALMSVRGKEVWSSMRV